MFSRLGAEVSERTGRRWFRSCGDGQTDVEGGRGTDAVGRREGDGGRPCLGGCSGQDAGFSECQAGGQSADCGHGGGRCFDVATIGHLDLVGPVSVSVLLDREIWTVATSVALF